MKRICAGILLTLTLFCCVALGIEQVNTPKTFNIIMYANADYLLTTYIRDSSGAKVNLTGYQYKAQFRSAPGSSGTLFANYSTLLGGEGVNGAVPAPDAVRVKLSHQQVTALAGRTGVWDLRQTDTAGLVTYILTGAVVVRDTVTQP
jgi:hypothetical protein